MPVQIDEVIITTTVNPQNASVSGGESTPVDPVENERELADKILRIIREKSER